MYMVTMPTVFPTPRAVPSEGFFVLWAEIFFSLFPSSILTIIHPIAL